MVIVYGSMIVSSSAWNSEYQRELFCIVFYPQDRNALILIMILQKINWFHKEYI